MIIHESKNRNLESLSGPVRSRQAELGHTNITPWTLGNCSSHLPGPMASSLFSKITCFSEIKLHICTGYLTPTLAFYLHFLVRCYIRIYSPKINYGYHQSPTCLAKEFSGVAYRKMDEGYLQEQKLFKDSCITKVHPSSAHESWKCGTQCISCRQVKKPKSIFSKWCLCSQPISGNLAGFCLFQAGHLIFCILLCLRQNLSSLCLPLGRRGLVTLANFLDFLELFELFPFWFKKFPCWMRCFSLWRNFYRMSVIEVLAGY